MRKAGSVSAAKLTLAAVCLVFAIGCSAESPTDIAPPIGSTNNAVEPPCDESRHPCAPIERQQTQCRVPGTPPGGLPQLEATIEELGFDGVVAAVRSSDGVLYALADGRLVDARGATRLELGAAAIDVAAVPGEPDRFVVSHLDGDDLVVADVRGEDRAELLRLRFDTAVVGGAVAVDASKHLYIGVGDDDSVELAAQDPTTFYGSVLRLALGELGSTSIPEDNPFDGTRGAAEVYAYGFHDPQSITIGVARIWVTDRGALYDEVNSLTARHNYGWPHVDGTSCVVAGRCAPSQYHLPLGRYLRTDETCGIAGAAEYPPDGDIVELRDTLLYADRCDGLVRALRVSGDGRTTSDLLAAHDAAPLVAVPDAQILVSPATEVELALAPDAGSEMFPVQLSATGCFDLDGEDPVEPASGLIPYFVRSPLWTDGAFKHRYLVIPPGESATVDESGHLEFPPGSLLFKAFGFTFADAKRPVEMRVMRRNARTWSFFTYRFDEAGDATVLSSREEATFDVELDGEPTSVDYLFPDSTSCRTCHSSSREVLGPRVDQLAGLLDYGDEERDQLDVLANLGLVEHVAATPMADPADPAASPDDRARAYLDANCAHCHRPGGWVPPDLTLDLRYATSLDDTQTCGVRMQYPSPFVTGDYRVVPGNPDQSALYQRMMTRDLGQMPLLATSLVDPLAEELIAQWIRALVCEVDP